MIRKKNLLVFQNLSVKPNPMELAPIGEAGESGV